MVMGIVTLPRWIGVWGSFVQTYSDFLCRFVSISLFQKNNFTTEESESSGDEKKQEITSNFKEESNMMRNFLQKSQKPSRSEIPVKR